MFVPDHPRGEFQAAPSDSHYSAPCAVPESRKVTAPTVGGHLSSASSGRRIDCRFPIADLRFEIQTLRSPSEPAIATRKSAIHLDSSLLRRSAPVVGQRGDVFD